MYGMPLARWTARVKELGVGMVLHLGVEVLPEKQFIILCANASATKVSTVTMKVPANLVSTCSWTAEAKRMYFGREMRSGRRRIAGAVGKQVVIAKIYRVKAPAVDKSTCTEERRCVL